MASEDGYQQFREELQEVINAHSMEGNSDTPDFILAQYLTSCLAAFDQASRAKAAWENRSVEKTPTEPAA